VAPRFGSALIARTPENSGLLDAARDWAVACLIAGDAPNRQARIKAQVAVLALETNAVAFAARIKAVGK
jgi:hypothetical protein